MRGHRTSPRPAIDTPPPGRYGPPPWAWATGSGRASTGSWTTRLGARLRGPLARADRPRRTSTASTRSASTATASSTRSWSSRWLYRDYFRAEAHGIENVPPAGRVLLVANHSGQLPFDGAGHRRRRCSSSRSRRGSSARWSSTSCRRCRSRRTCSSRWGQITGTPENCRRLLARRGGDPGLPRGRARHLQAVLAALPARRLRHAASCGSRSRPARRSSRSR